MLVFSSVERDDLIAPQVFLIICAILMLLCFTACTPGGSNGLFPDTVPVTGAEAPARLADAVAWRICIVDPAGAEVWSFTEAELAEMLEPFAHAYSTVNNWPTTRFYAAEGYSLADILVAVGLYDAAQTVYFRAADGYQVSFTAEQLFSPQYHYPQVGENGGGAEQVFPIIAYRWREGTKNLSEVSDNKPCLIIGQRNHLEHTNPAFVVGVAEILVDYAPCEKWPTATTFPLPGPIAVGETVKLQHPDCGLVKLHYTLDGSEPTTLSPMYNPSTYQLELNRPIPITEPTVIKVLVRGYGKADSEIAVFEFTPVENRR